MHDLAGLVAPRPLLVESGSRDPIFPTEAVRAGVERARGVYRAFGVEGLPLLDAFEGRHEISGALAYDFLAAALGAATP
jgi:predicted DsbA family dithiol-disulfide isomerase